MKRTFVIQQPMPPSITTVFLEGNNSMPAPESVKKLIETFGNNIDFYKSGQYNEAQLR